MVPKLNLLGEGERYKEFYGLNVEQMPKLIADGRIPMSVSQLMQRRLEVRNVDAEVQSYWTDNCFDTGDLVVFHPHSISEKSETVYDKLKVIFSLDSRDNISPEGKSFLEMINNRSKLRNGALVLPDKSYESLQGIELRMEDVYGIKNLDYLKNVKSNLFWRLVAKDERLLEDYVDYVSTELRQHRFYHQFMDINFFYTSAGPPPPFPLTPLYLCTLGDCYYSGIGRYRLDTVNRLVGVKPDTKE